MSTGQVFTSTEFFFSWNGAFSKNLSSINAVCDPHSPIICSLNWFLTFKTYFFSIRTELKGRCLKNLWKLLSSSSLGYKSENWLIGLYFNLDIYFRIISVLLKLPSYWVPPQAIYSAVLKNCYCFSGRTIYAKLRISKRPRSNFSRFDKMCLSFMWEL